MTIMGSDSGIIATSDDDGNGFGTPPAPVYKRPKRYLEPVFTTRPKRIWLVSFTDFMSIMTAFFVLLYAMGETQSDKFAAVVTSIQENLSHHVPPPQPKSFSGGPGQMGESDTISLARARYKTGHDLAYLAQVLDERRGGVAELKNIRTTLSPQALDIRLPLADITSQTKTEAMAGELARLISGTGNRVEIVVDWQKNTPNAVAQALTKGQALLSALHNAGISNNIPVMVGATPTSAAPDLALRITRFKDQPPSN